MGQPTELAPDGFPRFMLAAEAVGGNPRYPSFSASLALHVLLVGGMWTAARLDLPEPYRAPLVQELLSAEDRKLVWYPERAELPAIAPTVPLPKSEGDAKKPRFKLPQPITANDPNPDSERQMILTDAPEIPIEQDLPLPNILELKGPKVPAPRFDLQEPKLVAPPRKALAAIEAPAIETAREWGLDVPRFEKNPLLRFRARKQEAKAPERAAIPGEPVPEIAAELRAELDLSLLSPAARLRYQSLPESGASAPRRSALDGGAAAPAVAEPAAAEGLDLGDFQMIARLRYRSTPGGAAGGSAPVAGPAGEGAGPAPKIVAEAASTLDLSRIRRSARLRYQSFGGNGNGASAAPGRRALAAVAGAAAPAVTAPGGTGSGGTGAAAIAALGKLAPPPPPRGAPDGGGAGGGGTGSNRNLVVVGVDPSGQVPRDGPRGRRRGRFSAGPDGGPGGGMVGSDGDPTARVRVPNLSVSGAAASASAAARGKPARPGAGELERFIGRRGVRDLTMPPAPKIELGRLPEPIDPKNPFVGRPVYTLAVNMPNITSYQGSWIIQFAELEVEESEEGESAARPEDKLMAPSPRVKVDPKYLTAAAKEQIEGRVVLRAIIGRDGLVSNVEVVEGVDERLDESARQALEKWRFLPARKHGEPVAIEALVTMSFKLNPAVKVRY